MEKALAQIYLENQQFREIQWIDSLREERIFRAELLTAIKLLTKAVESLPGKVVELSSENSSENK
jgi:hypothetical protein